MTERKTERWRLRDLVDIHPGYPFRGKLPLNIDGDARVVQFRHIKPGQPLSDPDGSVLDRVGLPGRKKPNYLCPGDVLFMAKGPRNYAVTVGEVPENTVCTPNFFHLRLKAGRHNLLAEFLAWQLNHMDAQKYFAICSQGSVAPSVAKGQLGHLPISVPPMDQQNYMIGLVRAAVQEEEVLSKLIDNRHRMINTVGHQILHQENQSRVGND